MPGPGDADFIITGDASSLAALPAQVQRIMAQLQTVLQSGATNLSGTSLADFRGVTNQLNQQISTVANSLYGSMAGAFEALTGPQVSGDFNKNMRAMLKQAFADIDRLAASASHDLSPTGRNLLFGNVLEAKKQILEEARSTYRTLKGVRSEELGGPIQGAAQFSNLASAAKFADNLTGAINRVKNAVEQVAAEAVAAERMVEQATVAAGPRIGENPAFGVQKARYGIEENLPSVQAMAQMAALRQDVYRLRRGENAAFYAPGLDDGLSPFFEATRAKVKDEEGNVQELEYMRRIVEAERIQALEADQLAELYRKLDAATVERLENMRMLAQAEHMPGEGGYVGGSSLTFEQELHERSQQLARLQEQGLLRTSGSYHENIVTGDIYQSLSKNRAVQLEAGTHDFLKAQAKLQGVYERQANLYAKQNRGVIDAFVGGVTGHGFNVQQSFDPRQAVGNLAATAGNALRYSTAYGAIFAGSFALHDTIAQVKDYVDSLTDLEVALQHVQGPSRGFISDLENISQLAGANVGASIDAAVRGIRAFGDVTSSKQDKGQLQQLGLATAKAAGDLALIAGKDLKDATGDVIAIGSAFRVAGHDIDASGQSFDKGASGLNLVNDAISNAKRNLGGDPKQISQGLASIATAANEAGFSLNQTANLISLTIARNDESGQAAATRLSRIFSIIGNRGNQALLASFGIDTRGTVAQQLQALGSVYAQADDQEKLLIRTRIGGTANLRELIPLLEEYKRLEDANARSDSHAGAGAQEADRQRRNLAGTLKQIGGDIKNLQVNLGESGLFVGLGVGLKALNPFLQGVNDLLKAFNAMPAAVRGGIGVLTDLYLVLRVVEAIQQRYAAAAAKAAVEKNAETVATQRETVAEVENAQARRAATVATEGEATASALGRGAKVREGIGGTLATGRGLLRGGPGAAMAVFAGIALFGELKNIIDKQLQVSKTATDINELARSSSTANQLHQVSASLGNAAEQARLNGKDFFGIAGLLGDNRQASSLQKQADYFKDLAERVDRETRAAFNNSAVFTSIGKVGDGLDELAAKGVPAAQALDALNKSLEGNASRRLQPAVFGNTQNLTDISNAGIQSAVDLLKEAWDKSSLGDFTGGVADHFIDQKRGIEAVRKRAEKMGIKPGDALTDQQQEELAQALIGKAGLDLKGVGKKLVDLANLRHGARPGDSTYIDPGLGDRLAQAALQGVHQQYADLLTVSAQGINSISDVDLQKLLGVGEAGKDDGRLKNYLDQLQQEISGKDPTKGLAAYETGVQTLRDLRKNTIEGGKGLLVLTQMLDQWESQYANIAIDNAKQLLDSAQARAKDKGQYLSAAQEFFNKASAIALEQKDESALIRVFDLATETQAIALRAAVESALRAAELALATLNAQRANATRYAKAMSAAQRRLLDRSEQPQGFDAAQGEVDKLKQQMAIINDSFQRSTFGGDIFNTDKFDKQNDDAQKKIDDAKQKALELKIAQLQAATYPGSGLSEARTAIAVAQAQLGAAERGSADYYNALKALREAQLQLVTAEENYAKNLALNSIDITDPVKTAQAEVDDAWRKLQDAARNGAPNDVLAENIAAVRQAQAAAQRAAFDQQFNDARTNYELGRISYQQYLSYLESQHNYLTSIANKTRQQIDELNQVDEALKAAKQEMQGQFNLGDIKLPTPYEVRRVIKAQAAGLGIGPSTTVQNVDITINGGDLNQMKAVLDQYFGPQSTQRVGTTVRKV